MANPGASKVFTKQGIASLFSNEAISVTGVNGEPPDFFYDGMKEGQGFFLLQGKNIVDVEYARTRAGILHKSVTTSTGTAKQELTAEAGKSYRLGFDRNANQYVFEEFVF